MNAKQLIGYQLRNIKLKLQGFFYSGGDYYCPFCNRFYRKFLDGGQHHDVLSRLKVIGAGRRPNIICPGCHSTDRDRLLHTFICSYMPAFNRVKMLHIAPEPALFKWISHQYRLNPEDYIAGVKYHEGFYYNPNVKLLDITSLPFEDNSFGFVMANHVLEHIHDERIALSEIFRVLSPSGKAILQVPWSPMLALTIEETTPLSEQERAEQFGQFDHVRLYGRDYTERLRLAGFNVITIDQSQLNMDENYLRRIAINPDEVVFLATKQTKQ
jgi:SAM-dependent methyltransferase